MATAGDIINRSARRIGMLANEEALTSAEMTNALAAFNAMLHGFGPKGIQYAHVTLLQGDTINFPDEQERNVMLMFCRDLAQEYPVAISQDLMHDITEAESQLQAAYYRIKPGIIDPILWPRRLGRFDISRGR